MLDLRESVRTHPSFNRLEIGDLLFAEYTCPIQQEQLGLFTDTDYLVHVISGRKTWQTADGDWTAAAGDTLFFRKGAAIVRQHFEVEFCLLIFFLPDRFIRQTVKELPASGVAGGRTAPRLGCVARVETDVALSAFLQSMLAYFAGREKPPEALLELKARELILSVLTSGRNAGIASYLRSVASRAAPSVREIMEANFRFNLSLEEYARLCHRSLSSFKRDFVSEFGMPPGQWLLRQRLDYAAALLRGPARSITEVVFDSGFQDVSHFSRVFRQRFQLTPTAYRETAGTGH